MGPQDDGQAVAISKSGRVAEFDTFRRGSWRGRAYRAPTSRVRDRFDTCSIFIDVGKCNPANKLLHALRLV